MKMLRILALLKYGACAFLMSATLVHANCIEDSDLPRIADLKTLFSQGKYDDFFEQTKAVDTISEEEIQDAKVGLVQLLGTSAECKTLIRRSTEDGLYTDFTAYKSNEGALVFVILEMAEFAGGAEILMVQLSTDYVTIQKFLR